MLSSKRTLLSHFPRTPVMMIIKHRTVVNK